MTRQRLTAARTPAPAPPPPVPVSATAREGGPGPARQHQSQHSRSLGGQHQTAPRCQADPPGLGHHPPHGPAAKRFLHGPQHVVPAAQPRHDQQLSRADPVADQPGRVQVVVPGEPQERALPVAAAPRARPAAPPLARRGARQQDRAEPGCGLVPRHLVDAAQAQPATREGAIDLGDAQRQTRLLGRSGLFDSTDRPAERFRARCLRQSNHGPDKIPNKNRNSKSNRIIAR